MTQTHPDVLTMMNATLRPILLTLALLATPTHAGESPSPFAERETDRSRPGAPYFMNMAPVPLAVAVAVGPSPMTLSCPSRSSLGM